MDPKSLKQVVVARTDLNMRKGKLAAQSMHATKAFITRRLNDKGELVQPLTDVQVSWLNNSYKAIVLGVNSEEELLNACEKAKEAGIEVHLVTDSGLTEFHGIPTNTCAAFGPDFPEKLDPITGSYKLL